MKLTLALFAATIATALSAGGLGAGDLGFGSIAYAQATPPAAQPATPAATKPGDKPAEKPAEKMSEPAKPAASNQEKPMAAETAPLVFVKMSTNKGDIFLELNNAKAPISVANFLKYVDKKYYEGTIFHRVIDKFMIQGGGYDVNLNEKPGLDKAIKNEWQNGLKNIKGSVAMARTSNPDSATSQFFLNVGDNAFLDSPRPPDTAAYCVFGRVVGGMDVVDKIRASKTVRRGIHEAVPAEPIIITGMTRVTAEEANKGSGDKK